MKRNGRKEGRRRMWKSKEEKRMDNRAYREY